MACVCYKKWLVVIKTIDLSVSDGGKVCTLLFRSCIKFHPKICIYCRNIDKSHRAVTCLLGLCVVMSCHHITAQCLWDEATLWQQHATVCKLSLWVVPQCASDNVVCRWLLSDLRLKWRTSTLTPRLWNATSSISPNCDIFSAKHTTSLKRFLRLLVLFYLEHWQLSVDC